MLLSNRTKWGQHPSMSCVSRIHSSRCLLIQMHTITDHYMITKLRVGSLKHHLTWQEQLKAVFRMNVQSQSLCAGTRSATMKPGKSEQHKRLIGVQCTMGQSSTGPEGQQLAGRKGFICILRRGWNSVRILVSGCEKLWASEAGWNSLPAVLSGSKWQLYATWKEAKPR